MNLLRLLLFAAFCVPAFAVQGQISDNFSDGNFDQNPVWQGDAANFIVNPGGELQLNASIAGTSGLAVQGNIPGSTTWDLRFRLGFSPSTSNLLRIYLQADQQNLAAAKGYFLEIGETGSTDALRLFRADGGSNTLLATGDAGLVAVNPDIHVFVTRTGSGQWTVEAASGTGALTPQGTATDATHSGGANRFFGLQCVYTVSNITKFFFDDLNISTGPPDTDPPVLLSATAGNELEVTAVFSEQLDAASAESAANYLISGGIGQPASAALQPDGISVKLTLANPLVTGSYTLESNGVKDALGNASALQTLGFQFVKTETIAEFDILINEIMADPTPTQGLPEVEWVELFNRSTKILDLANLRFQDATGSPISFPTYLLNPGAYLIVTAQSNVATMQSGVSGTVLGLPISSTVLNNDGDILTLSDALGNVIDRVPYDLDWHTDLAKKDGGWSLERDNPGLTCLGSENWVSCADADGGTPGVANASLSTAPDVTAPRLLRVITESSTSLLVGFSEGIEKTAATNTAGYTIQPARAIASAVQLPNDQTLVRLTLSDPLQLSTVYALTANATLSDCSGNSVPASDTVFFGLAEAPALHDVVINEIMSKPAPTAGLPVVEYLELYNRSNKIIDLASLRVQDQSGSPATLPSYLLVPGGYVALVAQFNAAALQASTTGQVLGAAISSSLLNDDGDAITLSDALGNTIDRVAYDQSWHTTNGKEDGGWSLERINYDLPCLGAENWQSCPLLPGGTPGKINAAYQNTTDEKAPHLLWAYPESATSVLLTFSEGLNKSALSNVASYQFTPDLDILTAVQQSNIVQVRLTLATPLDNAVVYAITVSQTLTDCSGNNSEATDTVMVGLPQRPEPLDMVINEAMFNPATGNARYVEFYNRSNKIFDWSKFFIADFSNGTVSKQITQKRVAIPGQYHVFSSDAPNVREYFENIIHRNVMDNDLPTLDDKSGNITLYWVDNGDTVVLDAVDYEDDWHNALFSVGDRDGVALERIRIEGPTNDPANWTSASPAITGAPGTPTLPNSQRLSDANPADNMITLNPARLSPDDDGYEDFLDIQYQLPKEGYAATVGIFDADGNRVKYLVRQALAGTEGTLRWDGDADNGAKARPGIYILFVELFNPDGSVMKLKRVFVVAARK